MKGLTNEPVTFIYTRKFPPIRRTVALGFQNWSNLFKTGQTGFDTALGGKLPARIWLIFISQHTQLC